MNDKWIAGNSIGQRSLLEEFLFLDKANKDIGNEYYIDIARLLNLGEPENIKQNLFSSISILLQDTGFDLRALPAYINFYGTNFSNTPKLTPSKKIAPTKAPQTEPIPPITMTTNAKMRMFSPIPT